jgi:hypothetical protein
MGYSFDGVTKIISLTNSTTVLDVKDLYSRWKDWSQNGGSNYLQAFSPVGGDPVDENQGIYVTGYFFLTNGWRVRPQEANHKLNVKNGVLLTLEGEDPFLSTLGTYNVLVLYSQPVRSESTIIETGTSGLTSQESDKLMSIPIETLTPTEHDKVMSIPNIQLTDYIKNKKYLSKEGSTWYLIIKNDSGTADILKKALKDKNGNDISDISAGAVAEEWASSV